MRCDPAWVYSLISSDGDKVTTAALGIVCPSRSAFRFENDPNAAPPVGSA